MITEADRASMVASSAHAGQIRWDGEPYFNHVRRVADTMRRLHAPDYVVAAAYLHDVLEDTTVTVDELRNDCEFSSPVVVLVKFLTRYPDEETYSEFIERIAQSPEAAAVKRADLIDNMSTLPSGHGLWTRYLRALNRLHDV